ncbi:hypothetical protein BS329_20895 [Amycolatopsis coloradensis]|uniref:Uncharacterized protein n=2 Tax=Amycolatopsis coloradensis TaxID=76021 RepID=A0A1R0KQZ5_9PSEU|nr:hypothetical protein BS329_20895 [Amycolatopsis coloradensis]
MKKMSLLLALPAALLLTALMPLGASASVPHRGPTSEFEAYVTLFNQTNHVLTRKASHLDHGCWNTEPSSQIQPRTAVYWRSDSCGAFTGTEGWVTYTIEGSGGQGYAYAHWNLPYFGSNSFDGTAGGLFTMTVQGNNERHAQVNYTLKCVIPGC